MDTSHVHVAAFSELDPQTAYALWQLRESVFVVEQECAYQELDGHDTEPGTRHIWIEEQGVPIAYLRLLDEKGERRIGRVCVTQPARSRGLAERLMHVAIDEIGDRPSVLSSQAHLTGWYARFGYRADGPEYVEDGIPHVPMRRTVESAIPHPHLLHRDR